MDKQVKKVDVLMEQQKEGLGISVVYENIQYTGEVIAAIHGIITDILMRAKVNGHPLTFEQILEMLADIELHTSGKVASKEVRRDLSDGDRAKLMEQLAEDVKAKHKDK